MLPPRTLAGMQIFGMPCAIYTRKSSEEGLEQAFNSLAAQREASAAIIHSQRHEGWRVLEPRLRSRWMCSVCILD